MDNKQRLETEQRRNFFDREPKIVEGHQQNSLTLNNRDRTYDVECKPRAEFQNERSGALLCYWRWSAEGRPKYEARDPVQTAEISHHASTASSYDSPTVLIAIPASSQDIRSHCSRRRDHFMRRLHRGSRS